MAGHLISTITCSVGQELLSTRLSSHKDVPVPKIYGGKIQGEICENCCLIFAGKTAGARFTAAKMMHFEESLYSRWGLEFSWQLLQYAPEQWQSSRQ